MLRLQKILNEKKKKDTDKNKMKVSIVRFIYSLIKRSHS